VERIAFVTAEDGDDLIVSFATESDDPIEVKSLILQRTPKFEVLVPRQDHGVKVSFDDWPEVDDEFLRSIRITRDTVLVVTNYHRFEVDISQVERHEMREAQAVLEKMHFDELFKLEVSL